MDITVVGHNKVDVRPERARLILEATFESDDKNDAVTRTSALVGQLQAHIQELEGAGSSPLDGYNVLPVTTRTWRPYGDNGQVMPPRHSATSVLKVTFLDFEALSQFAATVGGTPGVVMRDVEWSLTDASRAAQEAQVQGDAVRDARRRAEVVAEAAGAHSLTALEIADAGLLSGVHGGGPDGDAGYGTPRMMAAAGFGGDAAESIDLAPEDIVVEATVHARFTTA